MNAPSKAPQALSVVMIGDFPRDIDCIGGGVESVMAYLCKELSAAKNINLQVVTLDRWGLGNRQRTYDNYSVRYVAQAGIRGPIRRLANIRRMAAKIGELGPDLVHAQIAGHYSAAAHVSGKPYVLTLHGVRYLEADLRSGLLDRVYRRRIIAREERRGIRQATNVISINPFIDECFPHSLTGRVEHIENPVADTWFDIKDKGDPYGLVYAGRITPRKDILTLLKAFLIFHSRYPRATLRIAGAPDNPDPIGYFKDMKAYVNANDLGDAVTFLGNLSESDLHAEYARNAVFVITSVLETAPMSIAQAQAAGRLVLATDAGGCKHMIRNAETGIIVPIGDFRAMGDALIRCVEEPGWCESMREATRRAAEERYRAATIAARTLKFYREILETRT